MFEFLTDTSLCQIIHISLNILSLITWYSWGSPYLLENIFFIICRIKRFIGTWVSKVNRLQKNYVKYWDISPFLLLAFIKPQYHIITHQTPALPLVGICRGITKILFIVIFSLMHKLKLKNCIYLKTLAEISSMDATNLVIEGSVSKVKYMPKVQVQKIMNAQLLSIRFESVVPV